MALTLAQKLEQAEQAYHDLAIGRSARVVVEQNGERVEFTAANAGRLQSYIQDLTDQINGTSSKGPLEAYF